MSAQRTQRPGWAYHAATVAAALAGLYLADRIIQPLPIPAAISALGALLGGVFSRNRRWRVVVAAAGIGLLAGLGIHLWVHLSGRSTEPAEGLLAHLAGDAAISLAAAAGVLSAAWLVVRSAFRLVEKSVNP